MITFLSKDPIPDFRMTLSWFGDFKYATESRFLIAALCFLNLERQVILKWKNRGRESHFLFDDLMARLNPAAKSVF